MEVGGVKARHTLYVAPELCAELILEEDWLKARKACLEFETAKLILGEVEVPLGGQERTIKTDHNPLKYLLEAE